MPLDISRGFTPVPNDLIDVHMPGLSDAAFKCWSVMNAYGDAAISSLMDRTGMSINSVRKGVRELEGKGLVRLKKPSAKEAVSLLKQKGSYQLPGRFRACEWCGTQTVAIEQHHFPIPRRDGGGETVSICAGCHREFHLMVDHGFYSLASTSIWARG